MSWAEVFCPVGAEPFVGARGLRLGGGGYPEPPVLKAGHGPLGITAPPDFGIPRLRFFGFFGNGEAVFMIGLEGPGIEFFGNLAHGGAEFADFLLGMVVFP